MENEPIKNDKKMKKTRIEKIIFLILAFITFVLGTYVTITIAGETVDQFWKTCSEILSKEPLATVIILVLIAGVCAVMPVLILVLIAIFIICFLIFGLGFSLLIELIVIIISLLIADIPNIEENRRKKKEKKEGKVSND